MTLTNIFVVGTAVVQVLYSTGTWLYIKKVRNELVFTFPDMGTWYSIIRCQYGGTWQNAYQVHTYYAGISYWNAAAPVDENTTSAGPVCWQKTARNVINLNLSSSELRTYKKKVQNKKRKKMGGKREHELDQKQGEKLPGKKIDQTKLETEWKKSGK